MLISVLKHRGTIWGFALLAIMILLAPRASMAQGEGADEAGGGAVAAPAANNQPPAAAPAGPAPAPAAASEGGSGDNLLVWLFGALGVIYSVVFLALSIVFVSLLVMCILASRKENICPKELVDNFEEKLNAKDFQTAYEMARNDESVLGQVLSAGLARLNRGYNKAIEGMQEVGAEESLKLDQRLSYLALIGSIAPMIGLLGTVHGMIESFQTIAASTSTPKPSELATGISKALVTTLMGLLIAIPALTAYNVLKNWVTRGVLEVGTASENLMSRFEDLQAKKA
jgi:biopolymer transport protein ExbB